MKSVRNKDRNAIIESMVLLVIVIVAICMLSCSDEQYETMTRNNDITAPDADRQHFEALVNKARYGRPDAYAELADCYRTGKGVKKDLISAAMMAFQAAEHSNTFCENRYAADLPEDDDYRMLRDATIAADLHQFDKAEALADKLIDHGIADGFAVKGLIMEEQGDSIGSIQMMEYSAAQGSSFGKLFLAIHEAKSKGLLDRLEAIADSVPVAYVILAEKFTLCNKIYQNDSLAIYFYDKADKVGMLDARGAYWLYNYYASRGIPLEARERLRLKTLSGHFLREPEDYCVMDTCVADSEDEYEY